jgi:GntR family phosphonate transport system transcriptional regulator
MMIDKNSTESVYSQISRVLLHDIENTLSEGEYLPPERVLAERFAVNRHTVRRAIEELIDAGVLERQRGRGTQVVNASFEYPIHKATRFTSTLENLGITAESRVIRRGVVPANEETAAHLNIGEGTPVVWIELVRLANDKPLLVASHFFPQAVIGSALDDYTGGSMHNFLREHCHVVLERQVSHVSADLPKGDDSFLLCISHRLPVLRVASVNVEVASRRPVEFCVSRFRADRIQLRINP